MITIINFFKETKFENLIHEIKVLKPFCENLIASFNDNYNSLKESENNSNSQICDIFLNFMNGIYLEKSKIENINMQEIENLVSKKVGNFEFAMPEIKEKSESAYFAIGVKQNEKIITKNIQEQINHKKILTTEQFLALIQHYNIFEKSEGNWEISNVFF